MKIKVDSLNIQNAEQRNSHRCMIADSIQQQVKWAKYIIVDLQSIRFSKLSTSKRHIFLTPPAAQQALLAFDRGEHVEPFEFTIARGITRPMRCRVKGFKRTKKRYKTSAQRKRYMPSRFREFGLRTIKR